MQFTSRLSRVTGLLVLLLTMLATVVASPAASAQSGDSSIEVHNRICPQDYQGQNFFEDCHANAPDPGLPFTFTDGVTREGTTNENGNIGFANLPAGTYTITGGAPGEFTNYYVYCAVGTEAESNQEQIPVQYVTGGIQLDLPAGTNVICDWYTIPLGQNGAPAPTATAETDTFDLPIYKLLCEEAPDTTAASDFVMMGTAPPAGCEQFAGVTVTVAAADGTVLGSCVTQAAAPCYVNVPIGATVYVTEDLTTVPEGYVPLNGETIEQEIPAFSEAWTLFINVRSQPPTPVPTATQVPPTPAPTATQVPPTATAIPVEPGQLLQIHEGACSESEEELGRVLVTLTDLRAPLQEEDLTTDVVIAETSSSTVPMTLDELIASDNAIVAYGEGDDSSPVACTEIAGPVNNNGELVLGLKEMDDSDYTGIVYLAPSDDGAQTSISVFLAEGLAEESIPATPGA